MYVESILKDPESVLDYTVDWSATLVTSTSPDETISTSAWVVPTGITKDSDTSGDDFATVWLSGGTAGASYYIENRIVTSESRTYDRGFIVRVTQADEPVYVEEVKSALAIETDDRDEHIAKLISASRLYIEAILNRKLLTQTVVEKFHSFPQLDWTALTLSHSPFQSVTSIQYLDANGDTQTWSSDEYQVDDQPMLATLLPDYGYMWPDVEADTYNAITITYVVGYGALPTDVPEHIRQAIILDVELGLDRPGGGFEDGYADKLKIRRDALLSPERVHRW